MATTPRPKRKPSVDQLPGNCEKNEKPAAQLTDTERQALPMIFYNGT
jgi:hypothetical protein